MNVPFHLRRRSESEPASALLLPTANVAALLDLCARLGLDPRGRAFTLGAGFLLRLDQPAPGPFPGTVRLRTLARNLLIPADAELVPALLDDEAAGLVRHRGLVFLPGGRVLEFAPGAPLDPADLLVVAGGLIRRSWQPLPTPPRLAERIVEIAWERPEDESPDNLLSAAAPEIGSEPPLPEDSGAATHALNRAALNAGLGMVWLGKLLGMKGLAKIGAQWIHEALSHVPQLSAGVLGRQEGALRDLLREFQEGNTERALRRALPLGDGGERGRVLGTGDHLPAHNLNYSLGNLIGDGGGPASVWLSGMDVQAELAREYRKAAEEATRRGDYRRAALIYGKLLRDYSTAAAILLKGGLHHDAAILYLHKVNNPLAAARAFEAGGESDRALSLYRQQGEHELAGNLLRRLGEEAEAIEEYRLAADQLVLIHRDYCGAGNLLLLRAGRPELALGYFEAGWARRPEGDAIPCVLRLAQMHANSGAAGPLLKLVDEADALFAPPQGLTPAAGQFYNDLARLAKHEALAPARAELLDRARLGLAAKLRQQAESGALPDVSGLFGCSPAWATAVVHDAEFAARGLPGSRLSTPPIDRVQLGPGLVTTVCSAFQTGHLVVGFEDGRTCAFYPDYSAVLPMDGPGGPIQSLATDPTGQFIVALHFCQNAPGDSVISVYQLINDCSYELVERRVLHGRGGCWLTPVIHLDRGGVSSLSGWIIGVWNGESLSLLTGQALVPWGELLQGCWDTLWSAQLLPRNRGMGGGLTVLVHWDLDLVQFEAGGSLLGSHRLGWVPELPEGSPLRQALLSWLPTGPCDLELVARVKGGILQWTSLDYEWNLEATAQATSAEGGYLAAALVKPGVVAGITSNRIDWFRCGPQRCSLRKTTPGLLGSAVAGFPSPRTHELIAVCSDGVLVRIPIPSV